MTLLTPGADAADEVAASGPSPASPSPPGTEPLALLRRLIVARPAAVAAPRGRFRVGAPDRALVAVGEAVRAGASLVDRVREPRVEERRTTWGDAEAAGPSPTDRPPGTPRPRGDDGAGLAGRLLYRTPQGVSRHAVGSYHELVAAPAAGTVEAADGAAIEVRFEGVGVPAVAALGAPTHGRLAIAPVDDADELLAGAIDVSASGAVLVGGSRVDVETISRARAAGVRALVVGGIVDRDLRAFLASEARQRAALHTLPPFALLVLDGYGKRPIPGPLARWFAAAQGRDVGVLIDPPTLVLPADVPPPVVDPSWVRVRAGSLAGTEGTLLGPAPDVRVAGGLPRRAALVAAVDAGGRSTRLTLPLADLERIA